MYNFDYGQIDYGMNLPYSKVFPKNIFKNSFQATPEKSLHI